MLQVDPDPGKEIEVDPNPERGLKWIRIRPNAVDPDPDPKRCCKVYCNSKLLIGLCKYDSSVSS